MKIFGDGVVPLGEMPRTFLTASNTKNKQELEVYNKVFELIGCVLED
jgi:hypothetical protein